jgi:hypothetical protein
MMYLVSVATVMWLALLSVPVSADIPPVTVTTTPQSLDLCPGGEGKALVVVQNNSQAPIHNACLTFFANGPIEAIFSASSSSIVKSSATRQEEACKGIEMPLLAQGGAYSTLVNAKLTDYPTTNAALYFRVEYPFDELSDSNAVTAVGTLDAHSHATLNIDKLKVETKTSFASLHEEDKGHVVLTITNSSNESIILSKPRTSNPPYASITEAGNADTVSNAPPENIPKADKDGPTVIASQSMIAIDYVLTTKKEITPGKYIGLIDVEVRTACGDLLHRVAAYDVTLGVFGQSELLTFIGVPSLLFLPGFLILALWMLIWRFPWQQPEVLTAKDDPRKFFIGGKDPEFWLLGVTLSLIIFAFARYLAGFGYQQPYGLLDIAKLWIVSLIVGFMAYVVFFILDRRIARYKAARKITSTDDVITVLSRIKCRKIDIKKCKMVKSKSSSANHPFKGFQLWSEDQGKTFWLIPPIKCRSRDYRLDELDWTEKESDTIALYESLKEAKREKLADVNWSTTGGLNGPTKMDESEFKPADEETFYLLIYIPNEIKYLMKLVGVGFAP